MKHVPKYLMPRSNAAAAAAISGEQPTSNNEKESGFVPFRKNSTRGRGRGRSGRGGGSGRGGKKKSDPLKKFGR